MCPLPLQGQVSWKLKAKHLVLDGISAPEVSLFIEKSISSSLSSLISETLEVVSACGVAEFLPRALNCLLVFHQCHCAQRLHR